MPRSAGMMAFADFRGFTRALIVWNLGAYFLLLVLGAVAPQLAATLVTYVALSPGLVLHGWLWQLVTYSFVHAGLLGTAMELLSIWFLSSFLERERGSRWVAELFFFSVAGAGMTAVLLALLTDPAVRAGESITGFGFTGAFGGIFGLLIAFAVLYGELQFTLFPLPIALKAKYLVAIYMLISVAQLFGANKAYALAQLGGALAGFLYIRAAGARRGGVSGGATEWYYGLRNRYYLWKRRQAAKKFEVYMRKQNRDVHFDSKGRYVAPEDRDPDDRKWMN